MIYKKKEESSAGSHRTDKTIRFPICVKRKVEAGDSGGDVTNDEGKVVIRGIERLFGADGGRRRPGSVARHLMKRPGNLFWFAS